MPKYQMGEHKTSGHEKSCPDTIPRTCFCMFLQVNLLAHNARIIRRQLYSGRLVNQGLEDVCGSLKRSICSLFRNNHRSEQPISVPTAHKQRNKEALLATCSWTKNTYSRKTSPLVYLNLPYVLVQVAGFPAVLKYLRCRSQI